MRWFSRRRSSTPDFWGFTPRGLWPQIRTRPRFLYSAPTPKFHHLCLLVGKLSCCQTNTRTNKQIDAAVFAMLRRWVEILYKFLYILEYTDGVKLAMVVMNYSIVDTLRDSCVILIFVCPVQCKYIWCLSVRVSVRPSAIAATAVFARSSSNLGCMGHTCDNEDQ